LPPNKIILQFITLLVKSIIRKEEEIKIKHEKILKIIDDELCNNQLNNELNHKTSFNDVYGNRFDAAPYSIRSKKFNFMIDNYINGKTTIDKLNFDILRGPNLAIQYIGKSIISDDYYEGFYSVLKPKNISKFGTAEDLEYLGNKNELNLLEKGDIVFGAEGFKKGRSFIVLNKNKKLITNYHGVILKHSENNLKKSIFIKCFLDYLRYHDMFDILGTGGNGGSFSPLYFNRLNFPMFPIEKQDEIAKLYYNEVNYEKDSLDIISFEKQDIKITSETGIRQLDSQIKVMRKKIKEIFRDIINNENPDISYDFLFIIVKE